MTREIDETNRFIVTTWGDLIVNPQGNKSTKIE